VKPLKNGKKKEREVRRVQSHNQSREKTTTGKKPSLSNNREKMIGWHLAYFSEKCSPERGVTI